MSEPWEVAIPLDGWGRLYAVTEGHCRLLTEGGEAVQLTEGDLVVLTRSGAHSLVGAAQGVKARRTEISSVAFRYDRGAQLPAGVPSLLHVRGPLDWLEPALRWLVVEASSQGPGREHVLARLVQVLLIRAIGEHIERHQSSVPAQLSQLTDPEIGRALAWMHRRPEETWTVASLATKAGLSRSCFSARFTAVLGEPPLQYLFRCRMGKACDLLRQGRARTKEVAQLTGYDSEAAFSRAFKRWTGVPPAAYRRLPYPVSVDPACTEQGA